MGNYFLEIQYIKVAIPVEVDPDLVYDSSFEKKKNPDPIVEKKPDLHP